MNFGKLHASPVSEKPELLADPVAQAIASMPSPGISVAEIDATLSDTSAFCAEYDIPLSRAANCVILEATRGEKIWHVAVIVLADSRADVNGVIRRHLDARKVSFASMEKAVAESKMEYGAITPIGLPSDWPILIDSRVAASDWVVVGSGIRKSKIFISGQVLSSLLGAVVIENMTK